MMNNLKSLYNHLDFVFWVPRTRPVITISKAHTTPAIRPDKVLSNKQVIAHINSLVEHILNHNEIEFKYTYVVFRYNVLMHIVRISVINDMSECYMIDIKIPLNNYQAWFFSFGIDPKHYSNHTYYYSVS